MRVKNGLFTKEEYAEIKAEQESNTGNVRTDAPPEPTKSNPRAGHEIRDISVEQLDEATLVHFF